MNNKITTIIIIRIIQNIQQSTAFLYTSINYLVNKIEKYTIYNRNRNTEVNVLKYLESAPFDGIYTKIGMIRKRLARPLCKDDMQICEVFHIFM